MMLIVDTHGHALPHWLEPVEVLLHQMHASGGVAERRRERDGASRWDICAAH